MVANTIELPLKSLIVSAEEDFSKVTINPESQSCLKEKKKKESHWITGDCIVWC